MDQDIMQLTSAACNLNLLLLKTDVLFKNTEGVLITLQEVDWIVFKKGSSDPYTNACVSGSLINHGLDYIIFASRTYRW